MDAAMPCVYVVDLVEVLLVIYPPGEPWWLRVEGGDAVWQSWERPAGGIRK